MHTEPTSLADILTALASVLGALAATFTGLTGLVIAFRDRGGKRKDDAPLP